MKKILKWGLIIFVGLIVLGMIGKHGGSTTQNPSPTPTQAPTQPQKVAAPTNPPTITDGLWKALDNSMKTRSGYSVEFDESSKTATITKTSTGAWDESALVRDSFTILVKYGTEVFKIDGVNAIRVVVKTELTDSYGKKTVEDVVRIIMSKAEFGKFDWKNLSYQPVYSQIKNASEGFYIHPAILKNLNPDKLYLAM